MTAVDLPLTDIALAASLLLVAGAASLWQRLQLGRPLAVAALRMTVQLLAIGLVLDLLLAAAHPLLVGLTLLVMLAFASAEIQARLERRFAGAYGYVLAFVSLSAGLALALAMASATALRPAPWFDARVWVPLGGMILGNAMTGVALAINTLHTAVVRERTAIEGRLALGASFAEALRPLERHALRQGLMPTINSMSATGLVFLPGMMTGQILAGVPPFIAVKYQLLVLFLLAGATAGGALLALRLSRAKLGDDRERLRPERLLNREG